MWPERLPTLTEGPELRMRMLVKRTPSTPPLISDPIVSPCEPSHVTLLTEMLAAA